MLEIKYSTDQCLAIINADAYLSVMTTAIQSCTEWLLCRGITRFSILRDRTPKGDGVLTIRPINQKAKPTVFASISPLYQLVDEGYFPKTIEPDERWISQKSKVRSFSTIDGSQRISGIIKNEGYTVVPCQQINTQSSISFYSFTFVGEAILPFFVLGSRFVKHQASVAFSENQYDISLSPSQLEAFVESGMGYNPQSIVADLPK